VESPAGQVSTAGLSCARTFALDATLPSSVIGEEGELPVG